MHEAGHPKPVLRDSVGGWGGEGGESRMKGTGIPTADSY